MVEGSIEGLTVEVRLSATVSPTEDPDKVLLAMKNVLGECDYSISQESGRLELDCTSVGCLQRLHDQLRDRHVRDAARRLLLRGATDGRRLTLLLHRQAAMVGIVAVCSSELESALGPLVLEMETAEPQRLIDWLTAY